MNRRQSILALAFLALTALPLAGQRTPSNVIHAPAEGPLYEVQIMVRAGSADEPAGKEGVAALAAQMLIEGGFGDPRNPVTKERLAEITRPWGGAARPTVQVEKQVTTFRMTVPRDVFPQFVRQVLRPMFQQPLWTAAELDRLRRETLVSIESQIRFEQQELLGLLALDSWIFEGTPLGHLSIGTVSGLRAVTRSDLQAFYRRHYRSGNMLVASSIPEGEHRRMLLSALPRGGRAAQARPVQAAAVRGRELLIITQPNAIATGLHAGFPIPVDRSHPDYWPLFVANVFLGTHRDSFGRLYQLIREERGYNYGNYSYIEYFHLPPYYLFPPLNTPRRSQYFSLWIRPVGDSYAHFLLKAMTYELERFLREGLTDLQVEQAKVKARTLYLNYAESRSRRLGYRLDDAFYGMRDHGYLETMLKRIDAVTPKQANDALRRHLQAANLKYVVVTNEKNAQQLADDIASDRNVTSKTLEEYHISEPIAAEKQAMLEHDRRWKEHPLNIARERIRIVPAAQMFEARGLPRPPAGAKP
jgi:zinc protease